MQSSVRARPAVRLHPAEEDRSIRFRNLLAETRQLQGRGRLPTWTVADQVRPNELFVAKDVTSGIFSFRRDVDSDGDEIPALEPDEPSDFQYSLWFTVDINVDPPEPQATVDLTAPCLVCPSLTLTHSQRRDSAVDLCSPSQRTRGSIVLQGSNSLIIPLRNPLDHRIRLDVEFQMLPGVAVRVKNVSFQHERCAA